MAPKPAFVCCENLADCQIGRIGEAYGERGVCCLCWNESEGWSAADAWRRREPCEHCIGHCTLCREYRPDCDGLKDSMSGDFDVETILPLCCKCLLKSEGEPLHGPLCFDPCEACSK